MCSENKFFLKLFFKKKCLKENHCKVISDKLLRNTKAYQKKIEGNIKKMGVFELKNLPSLTPKDIYKEYQDIWHTKGTLEGVSSKKLKNYFQILFTNSYEGVLKGLYNNKEQFDDFLQTLIKRNKKNLLKRLFSELFCHYPADKICFERLKKIYSNLDKQRRSHQALSQAKVKFHLIEEDSPKIIAKNILDIQKGLPFVLSEIWLKERHLTSKGIGEAIVKELSFLVQKFIQEENEPVLERFLDYLYEEPVKRFNNPKPITEALLRPFENKAPDKKSVKKRITEFLDKHVGDPRFESDRWNDMEREKLIFLNWKIGETLKDFFALLSYTAKQDPNAIRMWPDRKEFIEAYQQEGLIKKAWIVLGKEAYKNRFKFLKKGYDGYGRITRRANSLHSVLLFQIGDLILSEWNFNGRVRLWDSGNSESSPQFYQKEYEREDLVTKETKYFNHSYSENYYWQRELSYYIEQYTGILCPKDLKRKIDEHR